MSIYNVFSQLISIIAGFSLVLFPNSQPQTNKTNARQPQTTVSKDKSKKANQLNSLPKTIKLPILMYHHISTLDGVSPNDKIAVGLRVSPNILEEQIKYLQAGNYNTVTSQELAKYLDGETELPTNPIMLTFDDGYKDNFTNAFPLLQKYGLKGDFAIITSVVGTGEFMSWEDVQTIAKAGMGISSHTVSHCYLAPSYPSKKISTPNISPENRNDTRTCSKSNSGELLNTGQIYQELIQSKAVLESKLGIKVSQIIYPYGHYNKQVEIIVQEAGYKFATTVEAQVDNTIDTEKLFATPRVRVQGQQTGKLSGFFK